jgi:putative DeoR family transcriptional regulator (stage III sporulation protein D)
VGVVRLRTNIEERACDLAVYIIENKATVRAAAKKFGISKSTVHKDITDRLEQINRQLYYSVKEVLEENKAERHIRGGIATRKKYRGI